MYYITEANKEDIVKSHFKSLYHHMLKYMCQRHIQDTQWIKTINSEISTLMRLSSKIDYRKRIEPIIQTVYDAARDDTVKKAIDANEKFTEVLPKEMPKYFKIDYIVDYILKDKNNIYDFYHRYSTSRYVINYLGVKGMDMKEATVLPKNAKE